MISYWEYTDWDDDWNPIESVAVYSTYAFIDKWNKPIYSTNPFVTQDGKMHLLGMECDRVVWRLADLILLRAECRTRLKMPTAVDDLNRIRKRAGLKDYAGSTDPEILRNEKENFLEKDNAISISCEMVTTGKSCLLNMLH